MDVSDDRLAAARKNFAGLANASPCRGDILSPPFGPGTFDGALCRFVLEHLPEKEAAVRHMASLLKNGGKLLLQDADGQLVWNYPPDVSLDRDRTANTVGRATPSHGGFTEAADRPAPSCTKVQAKLAFAEALPLLGERSRRGWPIQLMILAITAIMISRPKPWTR